MRNILALLGATVIAFLALGWYLDWYSVERKPSTNDSVQRVEIEIDQAKIRQDVTRGVERGKEKLEAVLDRTAKSRSSESKFRPASEEEAGR